ncbi:lycopene cyclase domain-containing protein [Chryseobacterium sp.]|uniref:lycopene cyclase domain-containing protein n=1 Tax=Chryseobacterium sp. TaxID=1871047 RepID=UPI0011C8C86A|nr:lycopene cyclase domain-containing protein [Chryseobacterium sp.]TXF79141.1 lycopene cyclase domain-containing protein [Chryseobacterium sp.]
MQSYYYLLLDILSFSVPFLFSFEKKRMHFIQYWKAFFLAIFMVGMFFILWDIYFTKMEVWGFNDKYLIGFRIFKMPLEEYLFFLLIPYSSVFIHYAIEYFLPKFKLSESAAKYITIFLFVLGFSVAALNYDRIYTLASFGLFSLLMLLQIVFKWKDAQRYYLSFIIIYIPFYFVNNALTGNYSDSPVVFYDNAENLGIRVGTMPLEDSFYCFTLLYSIVLVFEYFKKKWNYPINSKNLNEY